jgi:hypothetical protein
MFGIGLQSGVNILITPEPYSSGDFISGSMTFTGQTFTNLGVTPGTYTYTWGTGLNTDSMTLQVGP